MTEWVEIPDYQPSIATECMVCGKEINLGYCTNCIVPKICEECKEAIKYAKKLMKEQETHKFFVDESGKITPLPVVVRCKDCKYAAPDMVCSHESEWGNEISRNRGNPNWYCADGECKEGR